MSDITARRNARRFARNAKAVERQAKALAAGKPAPKPEPTEDQIQRAVVATFHARKRPGVELIHVPNGGYRTPAEAARFKAQGVVAGVPDLVICARGQMLMLELKAKRGRLSSAQETMIERFRAAGAAVEVAFGVDEAVAQLDSWGLLK